MQINITTKQQDITKGGEVLVHFVFQDDFKKDETLKKLNELSNKKLDKMFKKYEYNGKENEIILIEIEKRYESIMVVGLGNRKDFNFLKIKNILPSIIEKSKAKKYTNIDIFFHKEFEKNIKDSGKNLALGIYLSQYSFKKYKSKNKDDKEENVINVQFIFDSSKKDYKTLSSELQNGIDLGKIVARGVSLARDLVNEPASAVGTEELKDEALKIQKSSKSRIKVEILDEKQCAKLGMGAYLSVGKGSERKPQFVIIKYQIPNSKNKKNTQEQKKKICFIGKSVVFDSGGLSIKPAPSMEDMKMDMGGGAAVLGLFQILSQWDEQKYGELNYDIYGILPACENMISGGAMRPGDIVKAMNGKTIEVLNTDAEGRLTLADALVYAEKNLQADYILDLATLTGACLIALGEDVAALLGNDKDFIHKIENLAKKTGDELWNLPLHKPYMKKIKSNVADLKNIGGRYGGTITAALFLSEFVEKAKWAHVDIAGTAYNMGGQKGVVPQGGTGWGVELMLEMLKS